MNQLSATAHPIILFDGVCNLCSASVKFIIRHDPSQQFRFASLQSAFGQEVMKRYQIPASKFNSFLLLDKEIIYTKSTGALRIVKKLNGLWPTLCVFVIIPGFIRNAVYDFIAKNRYNWFGGKEECWVPTPELINLFIM